MSALASAPDLLRLLAVPAFGWAAYRDVRTRRVPNRAWLPLLALGAVAFAIEAWLVATGRTPMPVRSALYFLRVGISVGLLVPLAYGFWWLGGFGGADAKALITLAVLFPTFPTYYLPGLALPHVVPTLGVFSLTVLSNTVVAGIAYPFVLTLRNGVAGHVSKAMVIGRPIAATAATEEYGRLLTTPEGFTRRGLDLDALRMYLSWRDTTLPAIRAEPERFRDPASLPAEANHPGDGSIPRPDGGEEVVDATTDSTASPAEGDGGPEDPWGAAAFLESIEGSAYGTTPEQLREGLDVLASEEEVWITPGIPFLVPMFVGLVVGLTYGDVLFSILAAIGLG